MNNFGLLGHGISYSVSPFLHSEIGRIKSIDTNYQLFDVVENQLYQTVSLLKNKTDGFNVTIPFKTSIIQYLDGIDASAANIGAVNTVKNIDGILTGYNTDVLGLTWALRKSGVSFSGKNVLILGAGGAALAAYYSLLDLSTGNIFVSTRNVSKERDFCSKTGAISFSNQINYAQIDILINATPVGTAGNNHDFHINLNRFTSLCYCYDMVYNPRVTKLCEHMSARAIPCDCGLSMLAAQGAFSSQIWHGITLDDVEIDTLISRISVHLALKNSGKSNIALCGFMAAGKTTLGAQIAEKLDFDFCDTDTYIEKQVGASISDIFKNYGEQTFRDMELDFSSTISAKQNCVISLGGGFTLNECALFAVREHCILIFLDTPFETISLRLKNDTTRPLLQTSDIHMLYCSRLGFYKKNAHVVFTPLGISLDVDASALIENI